MLTVKSQKKKKKKNNFLFIDSYKLIFCVTNYAGNPLVSYGSRKVPPQQYYYTSRSAKKFLFATVYQNIWKIKINLVNE